MMRPEDVPLEYVDTGLFGYASVPSMDTIDNIRGILAAVIPLIQKAERERCAMLCEELRHEDWRRETEEWVKGLNSCAAAIRALDTHPREASGVVSHETPKVRDNQAHLGEIGSRYGTSGCDITTRQHVGIGLVNPQPLAAGVYKLPDIGIPDAETRTGYIVKPPRGCICPPGAEATCKGPMCPRKPIGAAT